MVFRGGRKADLVMDLTCDWKERDQGSRMLAKLRSSEGCSDETAVDGDLQSSRAVA